MLRNLRLDWGRWREGRDDWYIHETIFDCKEVYCVALRMLCQKAGISIRTHSLLKRLYATYASGLPTEHTRGKDSDE
jgi:hypothetical protein